MVFLLAKECGDQKLVGRAGVVKERVAGVVMGKMSVAGDENYSVSKLHVGPAGGGAKYCACVGARFNFTVVVELTGRCSYALGRQGPMEWKERPRVCAASMTEF